jgi:hypothetical protein
VFLVEFWLFLLEWVSSLFQIICVIYLRFATAIITVFSWLFLSPFVFSFSTCL